MAYEQAIALTTGEIITAMYWNQWVVDNTKSIRGQWNRPFSMSEGDLPVSNPATLATRNGFDVMAFTATVTDRVFFSTQVPSWYAGAGLCVCFWWASNLTTTTNVLWEVALESHTATVDDLDADSYGTVKTVLSANPSTAGWLRYEEVFLGTSAETDSIVAGESCRFRVSRLGADASDDLGGVSHLFMVALKEP